MLLEASFYIFGIEPQSSSNPNHNSVLIAADDVNLCRADAQIKLPSRGEVDVERMMREIMFDRNVVLRITRNG